MSGSDVISPDDEPPYKVGYGKPSKEHQFQKGKSGNLKGRLRRAVPEKIDPGPSDDAAAAGDAE